MSKESFTNYLYPNILTIPPDLKVKTRQYKSPDSSFDEAFKPNWEKPQKLFEKLQERVIQHDLQEKLTEALDHLEREKQLNNVLKKELTEKNAQVTALREQVCKLEQENSEKTERYFRASTFLHSQEYKELDLLFEKLERFHCKLIEENKELKKDAVANFNELKLLRGTYSDVSRIRVQISKLRGLMVSLKQQSWNNLKDVLLEDEPRAGPEQLQLDLKRIKEDLTCIHMILSN